MEQFLQRCFYHSGQYDSQENFAELDKILKKHEVSFSFFLYSYMYTRWCLLVADDFRCLYLEVGINITRVI